MTSISRDFVIRPATAADLSVLVSFRVDFIKLIKSLDADAEAELSRESRRLLAEGMRSGKQLNWICELNGIPIAACGLLFRPAKGGRRSPDKVAPDEGPPRRVELMGVYTVPARRRIGAAAALVGTVIAAARAMGLTEIRLQPTDDARALYSKFDFLTEGEEMVLCL